jgi:hypothetical protein
MIAMDVVGLAMDVVTLVAKVLGFLERVGLKRPPTDQRMVEVRSRTSSYKFMSGSPLTSIIGIAQSQEGATYAASGSRITTLRGTKTTFGGGDDDDAGQNRRPPLSYERYSFGLVGRGSSKTRMQAVFEERRLRFKGKVGRRLRLRERELLQEFLEGTD